MPEAVEVIVATIMRPTGETGVQTHFQAFRRWLLQQGLANTLITPYDSPLWLVYPVFGLRMILHRLNGRWSVWWYRYWHAFFLGLALRRRLRNGQACVVYAQCPLSAAAALKVRRIAAQRVVMVVHFNMSQADEWAQKGLIKADSRYAQSMRAFEARTLLALDGLVFVSAFMQRSLTERIPAISAVPSTVIPNFVADPGLAPEPRGIDADLICIGTLEPRKNQTYALDVVAAAAQLGLHLSISLVGNGPDLSSLRARAAQLGISEQVHFLGFRSDIATLIPRHRACLHVARMESFGIALIESMSQGLPVFAAEVGGVPEVLIDCGTGEFVPLDEPKAAAAILARWFNDAAAMAAAGAQSRARFLSCFESQAVARKLYTFLQEPRPQ